MELHITSLATERGRAQAAAFDILSVPTILVGAQPIRFTGVPARAELLQAIEKEKKQNPKSENA